ncbi:carboxylate--amine ligase [Holzapfeliella floricola]|uniref:ATP-grasp domain-containing protein n=1 Tax=Holzapfeliella floricola DSM 23037 = JCM 16512 TaxID=1423744 RepID=A0A0R2DWZ2_9LACO|nr:carboxylate--amine ligase [Holzapfeliella floricola]KRN04708.1 hypothetical protein FC86_GL001064 [Holzapfeliella floricola DSM 23037 = JCM 16512]
MNDNQPKFTPILLGSDINVYGMARSFHEAYGMKVKAWASGKLAATRYANIVEIETIPNFGDDEVFIEAMRQKAEIYKNHSEPVILIACGDAYAELLSKYKDELKETFIVPYIDYDLLEKLNHKDTFYQTAEEYDLPYPKTKIIDEAQFKDGEYQTLPFDYPIALKPANSVKWAEINFPGKKKAYTIQDEAELKRSLEQIYAHNYRDRIILQEFIPGDDSNMRVLNAYVDQDHQVKMMCLGHPLLEDPTPHSIGNYVAIIPEYNQALYERVQSFLEAIKFTGYANFDMKYDHRDGQFKFFEINLRQGRSSFYTTLNGYNLAEWVVKDYVTDELKSQPTTYANQAGNKHMLWLGVPEKVFKKYATDNEDKAYALELIRQGRVGTTVFYDKDMGFKRFFLMKYMFHNYIGRFKKYFEENKGQNI